MSAKVKQRSVLFGFLMAAIIFPAKISFAENSVLENFQTAFIKVAKDVHPSVVNISTVQKIKSRGNGGGMHSNPFHKGPFNDFFGDDLLEDFFKNMPRRGFEQKSLGSGFIVDERGYILTNNHVIEKADEITVRLSDKTKFEGKVLGKDPKTDLAVIKIDPGDHKLVVARLGDSDNCQPGQWAIAIGNPFGLDRTVTVGVISAIGRAEVGITTYENFIQTDASINPGNSGGPLLNLNGEVVGINTAIVASGQGIGFAVPINMARQVMEQLIEHGRVVRGWMGIAIQQINEELGKQFGVKEGEGVLVGQVFKGDPAEKAGIQVGDVIVEFDGKPISSPSQLSRLAAATPPDKTIDIVVVRDQKRRVLKITLGEQKEDEKTALEEKDTSSVYGMEVDDITPQAAKKFNLRRKQGEGVVITHTNMDGPAAKAGLRPGDVLVEINRKKIKKLSDYNDLMDELKEGESLVVLRVRNQNSLYVVVEVKE